MSLITLTTDFGEGSPYVAAMKGVVLGINPAAVLVDLSQRIPPHDLRCTSFFLCSALPYFPAGSIHLVVVDPGVGTQRALLLVELSRQFLLVPDNGCWTALGQRLQATPAVIQLTERRYWRSQISPTFHGRDILAPVAGHLSLGVAPRAFGSAVTSWQQLELPQPAHSNDQIAGEVIFIDAFGNLITNIPGELYQRWQDRPLQIRVAGQPVTERVHTYGDAAAGTLVALVSSSAMLEIAVTCGSAAERLAARVGTPVEIST